MARKAAQKKQVQASPLNGCSIATSGRFPGTTQSVLQSRISDLGGIIANKVTADTSVLIATDKDFEAKSTKVAAAIANDIPIVSIDWLEETESSNTKADETQYSFVSPSANASSPASPVDAAAAVNGKKRAASPGASHASSQTASQSKKRKTLEEKARDEKVKVGDGQNAKSKKIAVSVDEYCTLPTYEVYIDNDGLVWDAALNQTNASANNNKFYKVQVSIMTVIMVIAANAEQLLRSPNGAEFHTWTRWGRVGERGLSAMLGSGSLSDAIKMFEKKFKDKSGLRWEDRGEDPKNGKCQCQHRPVDPTLTRFTDAYVEKNYNPDSDEDNSEDEDIAMGASGDAKDDGDRTPAQSTLTEPVQNLMELIFNQKYFQDTMKELNYDVNKMPLGKLSKGTITRGFQTLKDLAAIIDNPTSYGEVEVLSNRYYSLIPHAFGRNRPPVISTNALLKKEIDLLESLSDMKEATDMLKASLKEDSDLNRLDRQFQTLGMDEMEALEPKSLEFVELSNYLTKTKGATHNVNYAVQDIFRIQRKGEFERFDKSAYAKRSGNRRLLWHGSRVTNFAGILGQGLRIAPPEAPVSGYMFGKGIYLADMSSKSANYCCHYQSGGTALLLLCEAELGNPVHELTHSSYTAGEDAKAKGMVSTLGKGRVGPNQWKDAGCVHPSLAGTLMVSFDLKSREFIH